MKGFIKRYIWTRCEVIIDEKNMTDVLKVLDSHEIHNNLSIGNCGWQEGNMWYVGFTTSVKNLESITDKLKKKNFNDILILTNTNQWVKVQKLGS